MASVRKRKMAKSSVKKASRRQKDKFRKVNITSNPIIADNWDYSLTLSQNYEKLGLKSKLQAVSGGKEADLEKVVKREPLVKTQILDDDENEFDSDDNEPQVSEPEGEVDEKDIPEGEARILRDNKGNIVKVVYGKRKSSETEAAEPEEVHSTSSKTKAVKELEAFASRPTVKKERVPSEREEAWLKALYTKHGDNYRKMFYDKKLNINQQTEADIKRRISNWKLRNHID